MLEKRKNEADAWANRVAQNVKRGRQLLQDADRLLKKSKTPRAKYQAEAKKIEALSILRSAKSEKLSLVHFRKTGKKKYFPLKNGARKAIAQLGRRV